MVTIWILIGAYLTVVTLCLILNYILINHKSFMEDTERYPLIYWRNYPYLSLVPILNFVILYEYVDILIYYIKYEKW